MNDKDKVAVVTGGQGLGRCIAKEFLKVGATVCVTDTAYTIYETACRTCRKSNGHRQQVLFLCSGKAGFISGENICINGGMTSQMIYHGDNSWALIQ